MPEAEAEPGGGDHSLLGDLGLAVFALIMIGFLGFSMVDAYERYKRKMAKKHD